MNYKLVRNVNEQGRDLLGSKKYWQKKIKKEISPGGESNARSQDYFVRTNS